MSHLNFIGEHLLLLLHCYIVTCHISTFRVSYILEQNYALVSYVLEQKIMFVSYVLKQILLKVSHVLKQLLIFA